MSCLHALPTVIVIGTKNFTDGTREIGFVVAINRLIRKGDKDPFIAHHL